ncbi:alpha beta-hydrolase [Coniophora puteana RWD-64-598 SS2]|uniref:triacylglycerol lipase n=1 Tax=Coniophora puteana (strain RWD-64-598) TaxID=741705 RepID=A0A5M3N0P7_CONPW|nr:alpha beta-hydrolase [Coniophora puteana RWD-64-598 SS2]EIW84948.1 alpha beta-hydrolase [Coniophora puteana RWD-64-598 SS2]
MLALHAILGTAILLFSHTTRSAWALSPSHPNSQLVFDLAQEFQVQLNGSEAVGLKFTSAKVSDGTHSASLKSVPTTVYRPRSFDAVENARKRSLYGQECESVEWVQTEVSAPDVTDRYTLAQLGRMTANAYKLPADKKWYPLDPYWNTNASFPFGWEDDQDGFRGHVFRSRDESTVVLSIKGTTIQGVTSDKDKFNDNLLFSCCCARVDFTWTFSTVCDCFSWSPLHLRCDDTCLTKALVQDSLFYSVGVDLIRDLLFLYPTSDIWLVGHSLGGALASLLGSTFGLPAVAFEAPGERLAAKRLHLPLPPSLGNGTLPHVPITHVYHNADPIPQGTCSGLASICAQAGYALETRCHLGKSIVYDTVGRLGWHADVTRHPIKEVVFKVLEDEGPWPDGENGEAEVPTARGEEDCIDCYKWEFGDFKKDKGLGNLS